VYSYISPELGLLILTSVLSKRHPCPLTFPLGELRRRQQEELRRQEEAERELCCSVSLSLNRSSVNVRSLWVTNTHFKRSGSRRMLAAHMMRSMISRDKRTCCNQDFAFWNSGG
jgi:hypothetical protein